MSDNIQKTTLHGLAQAIRIIRNGGMAPWYSSSVTAWTKKASSHQRRRAIPIVIAHMLRAKRNGNNNRAGTWLELAAALSDYSQ